MIADVHRIYLHELPDSDIFVFSLAYFSLLPPEFCFISFLFVYCYYFLNSFFFLNKQVHYRPGFMPVIPIYGDMSTSGSTRSVHDEGKTIFFIWFD